MSLDPGVPVVVLASAGFDSPAPVNVHHIARRMAARGHRVLFVESTGLRGPSAGSSADRARLAERLRGLRAGAVEREPGLHVLSPVTWPAVGPRALRRAGLAFVGAWARRAARALGMERPVVWSFLPTALHVAPALDPRLWIYQCVDHYAANPGVDRAWVEGLEGRLLERADLVFATSPVLAERLRGRSSRPVELWPNVADVPLFRRALEPCEEPEVLAGLPRPRLVYLGNLARYRIDFAVLERLAEARPDRGLVLIGALGLGDTGSTDPAGARLARLPNVRLLGPRPPAELPALLHHCDVGLLPFLDNEHTRGSLPLKLYEYIAAGLPVVARALPNLVDAPAPVHLVQDADGFVEATDRVLAEPGDREECSRHAEGHDWVSRIEAYRERIGRALEEP